MNPISRALLYPQLSADITRAERSDLARRIVVNAGLALLIAMWAGAELLSVFGIGTGALRIAGGLMVAAQARHLLGGPRAGESAFNSSAFNATSTAAFVHLTIPFTTGPGTLAAVTALGAAHPAAGAYLLGHFFGLSAAALARSAGRDPLRFGRPRNRMARPGKIPGGRAPIGVPAFVRRHPNFGGRFA